MTRINTIAVQLGRMSFEFGLVFMLMMTMLSTVEGFGSQSGTCDAVAGVAATAGSGSPPMSGRTEAVGTGVSAFDLAISPAKFVLGGPHSITLTRSSGSGNFRGLLLYVEDNGGARIGSWDTTPADVQASSLAGCNTGATITHTSSSNFADGSGFTWTAPGTVNGPILIRAIAYDSVARVFNVPQPLGVFEGTATPSMSPSQSPSLGPTDVPTLAPTTAPTSAMPTTTPTTAAPSTNAPTMTPATASPITAGPATGVPTTGMPSKTPTTATPTTAAPVTGVPTTAVPTTAAPITAAPVTRGPTRTGQTWPPSKFPSATPTTAAPSTNAPTMTPATASPITAAPTTGVPTTGMPTTTTPTTAAPSTTVPTAAPTTGVPTTAVPTTATPTTAAPLTRGPTRTGQTWPPSEFPTTANPSMSPATNAPTMSPATTSPITAGPATGVPTTGMPTTTTPTTAAPSTRVPTTASPTTATPTTGAPTTRGPTRTGETWPPSASPTTTTPSMTPTTNAPSMTPTTSNPTTAAPTGTPSKTPSTAGPTMSPVTSAPTRRVTTLPLRGQCNVSTTSLGIRTGMGAALKMNSTTAILVFSGPVTQWFGVGYVTRLQMVGAVAVIYKSGSDVQLYDMKNQTREGIVPRPPSEQVSLLGISNTATTKTVCVSIAVSKLPTDFLPSSHVMYAHGNTPFGYHMRLAPNRGFFDPRSIASDVGRVGGAFGLMVAAIVATFTTVFSC